MILLDTLYIKKINYWKSVSSTLLLFGIAYCYLIQGYWLSEFSLPLAGVIVIYFSFGKEGFHLVFAPLKKQFTKTILYAWLSALVLSIITRQVGKFFDLATSGNIVNDTFASVNLLEIVKEFLFSGIQIIGEELITIVPMIIFINLCLHYRIKKKTAIVAAVSITSLLFGALHLSTYNWNIYQSLIVIGLTRIPFTLATLKQNTIFAGILSHIMFDWFLFLFIVLASVFHLT